MLYDVYGELPGREQMLDHLAGYVGSRPVRIGNAAVDQLQLDVYGEVIEAVTEHCRRGRLLDRETQQLLRQLGEYVCRHWREPDQGHLGAARAAAPAHPLARDVLGRAGPAAASCERAGSIRDIPRAHFERERDLIRDEVERRGCNPDLRQLHAGAGRRHGRREPAAARSGTASPAACTRGCAARYQRIMRAAARRARPALPLRARARPPARARSASAASGRSNSWPRGGGTLAEATAAFERCLAYANDLGLFAEEIDPATGRRSGNFPQAFTPRRPDQRRAGARGAARAASAMRALARRDRELRRNELGGWLVWGFAGTRAC